MIHRNLIATTPNPSSPEEGSTLGVRCLFVRADTGVCPYGWMQTQAWVIIIINYKLSIVNYFVPTIFVFGNVALRRRTTVTTLCASARKA